MSNAQCGKSGSVLRAERKIVSGLHSLVQARFNHIMIQLRGHLKKSRLTICTPPSEEWITIKVSPRKAVIAFINEPDGRLHFDIDTYADNDITDPRGLLELIPNEGKPNKRHVGYISPETPDDIVKYYIKKMIEGIRKFRMNIFFIHLSRNFYSRNIILS